MITRSQSGKRDPRNGQQIEKGTNFRFTTLNGRWNAGRNVIVYQRNYASLPDGRALGTGQQKRCRRYNLERPLCVLIINMKVIQNT